MGVGTVAARESETDTLHVQVGVRAPAFQEPQDSPARPPRHDVPLSPIVIEEVGPITPETGVGDILLGSIALVAAILVAGLLLGTLGGVLRVYIFHRLGYGGPDTHEADHIRLAIGRDEAPAPAPPSGPPPPPPTKT